MRIRASWDDCCEEDLRLSFLMAKYNIPTTFYWPVYPQQVNEIKGRKSLSDVKQQAIAKLFDIGSHTINHPLLTRIDLQTAWIEVNDSRKILQEKFDQPIDSFCYPRGYANADLQKMVEDAGYESARSTLVGYIHESENPYFEQTTVHIGCPRKEYAGLHWLKYAFNMLEEAIKTPNSIFSIFGHGWEIEKYKAWDDLETLLRAL